LRAKILGSNPHVLVLQTGTSLRMDGWDQVLERVRTVDAVVGAAPFVVTSVGIQRAGYAQTADLYGVLPQPEGVPVTDFERDLQDGVYSLGPTESGYPPVLVGSLLAQRMQLFKGDTLVLVSLENVNESPMGGLYPTVREFEMAGRRLLVETGLRPAAGRNRTQVNRQPLRRAAELQEQVPVLTFQPDDLLVVKGSPGARRDAIDGAIVSLWPRAAENRRRLAACLRQRNALLRRIGPGHRMDADSRRSLDIWDDRLAAAGETWAEHRRGGCRCRLFYRCARAKSGVCSCRSERRRTAARHRLHPIPGSARSCAACRGPGFRTFRWRQSRRLQMLPGSVAVSAACRQPLPARSLSLRVNCAGIVQESRHPCDLAPLNKIAPLVLYSLEPTGLGVWHREGGLPDHVSASKPSSAGSASAAGSLASASSDASASSSAADVA